ncbi:MAG: major facilitator superfamily 1 [Firmicutes bacterium]|nr:major facilitator superfamily 1 [Bacillota bacterium]
MGDTQKFYGWKMLGALWFLYFLNMGFPLYGGIIANTYMLKEITMERSIFGLSFTLMNFFVGVPSFLVASSIVKWGVRRTFCIGIGLITIGGLLMSFWVSQPWQYLVVYGCTVGLGQCFCTIVPMSTAITRWFVRFRGRAMGIALTASGFSGFVGAPIINKVLEANGGDWRQAWLVIVSITVVAGIIACFFIKERPEDLGQLPDGMAADIQTVQATESNTVSRPVVWTPAQAYKTVAYWLVVVGCIGCSFPFYWVIAHMVLYLKGIGIAPANAAWAMGLYTMGGIGGRLVGGWLMDKMTPRYAFILGLISTIAGSVGALFLNGNLLTLAYASVLLLGVGFGWTFCCMNAILANFFGSAPFVKLFSMLMVISTIICAPSGFIGGKIFDIFKSYTPAIELNIVLCVISIIALLFAKAPQLKNADSSQSVKM